MINANIILTSNKELMDHSKDFSVEFGFHDGLKHFDHHGEFSAQKAPCANVDIPVVTDGCNIFINHVDADCYLGVARMLGAGLPPVDFSQMERVDLNGSHVLSEEERFNQTAQFYVGVGQMVREFNIPRADNTPQNISRQIYTMIGIPFKEVCRYGEEAICKMYSDFEDCIEEMPGGINAGKHGVFLVAKPDKALNPSVAYDVGYQWAVVYRPQFETVSCYAHPESDLTFSGKTISGIEFAGHPKACGSPRGLKFSLDQAHEVYRALLETDGVA